MEYGHTIAVKQDLVFLVMPFLGFRILPPLQGDRACIHKQHLIYGINHRVSTYTWTSNAKPKTAANSELGTRVLKRASTTSYSGGRWRMPQPTAPPLQG